MTENSLTDQKASLRKSARGARQHVFDSGQGGPAAERLATHDLASLSLPLKSCVSGFSSVRTEIDTGPLMHRLHNDGFKLALPVIVEKDAPLVFRDWTPGDDMTKGPMGIPEPLASAAEVVPDGMLIPLLAFDQRGYRLGYGGGFYDRSLAKIRKLKPVLAIGVAFDEQEVDAVPIDRYDEPLDWVLTPTRVLKCAGC